MEKCPHWRRICRVWIEEILCPINASGTARQICVHSSLDSFDRCISCLSSAKLSLWSPLAQYDAPMIFIWLFSRRCPLELVITQVSRCLFREGRRKWPHGFKVYFLVKTISQGILCAFYHNQMVTPIEDVFDQGTISMSLVGVQALTAFPAELAKSWPWP